MYINAAYVDDENPNTEDLATPIKTNNGGYYRVHTTPVIETPHPEGRNDYQLLYIAAGKGYLENGDKSINEISNIAGYENALYFSRLFKKYTACTCDSSAQISYPLFDTCAIIKYYKPLV